MRSLPRLLLVAGLILFIVAQAYPCTWTKGYFYQVTRLRGKVVGAKIDPLQHARWLRQSFAPSGAKLTVYEYRWPIQSRSDMPLIKSTRADSHGGFDFGELQPGHYMLIVDDEGWGHSDQFDFEVTNSVQETVSVTIDISPNSPIAKAGTN